MVALDELFFTADMIFNLYTTHSNSVLDVSACTSVSNLTVKNYLNGLRFANKMANICFAELCIF